MKKVNISQVDALFSNGCYPIEFLFYYKEGFGTKKLRRSLKDLSSFFWPLFGEYRDGTIFFDKYLEEDFYEEEIADLEFPSPESVKNRFDLYSRFRLPDLKRLFFLKVIRLKNGLILIPKMNHLAGDGYSYFYFLSLLATLSQPTPVPTKTFLTKLLFKPHHRRTILKDFAFKGIESEPVPQSDRFIVEFEEIPREDVQSLIKEVVASHNLRVSTNDVLSALAIKKLAGRPRQSWGEKVSLIIPIDVRRRIKEYGRRFFGNGIMIHTIGLKKVDVENSPVQEIAVHIRRSMPLISKETYIQYISGLEKSMGAAKTDKLKLFDPSHGCLVTNLSKLPSDKLNFGSGGPELILPLTTERNSTAILAKDSRYILRYAY